MPKTLKSIQANEFVRNYCPILNVRWSTKEALEKAITKSGLMVGYLTQFDDQKGRGYKVPYRATDIAGYAEEVQVLSFDKENKCAELRIRHAVYTVVDPRQYLKAIKQMGLHDQYVQTLPVFEVSNHWQIGAHHIFGKEVFYYYEY